MRKIRETLRYRNTTDFSLEGIAKALKLSKGVVVKYLQLAQAEGLTWPLPEGLDDTALERLLFQKSSPQLARHIAPDYADIHQELGKKGVTLQLLWRATSDPVGCRQCQFHQGSFGHGLRLASVSASCNRTESQIMHRNSMTKVVLRAKKSMDCRLMSSINDHGAFYPMIE